MDVAAHWAMAAEEVRRAAVQRRRSEADPEAPGVLGARTGRSLGKEGLSLQLGNPGLRWEDSDLDLPAGFRTRGKEKE